MDKKSKIIGICVSQLQDAENASLIHAISRRARVAGYRVLIYGCFAKMDWPTDHSNGEATIFRDIPMESLTALILLGQTILHRELLEGLRDEALAVDTPVITVDYWVEGCFNITLDYLSCFKRLVHHVIEGHHCRNPFFMAGYRGNAFSDERLNAYKEVLEENGMPVISEHIAYGDFWEEPARMACELWMERKDDLPDAIICANDVMGLTVMNVLEEHGLHVPDDVIVTGFDGIARIYLTTPRLTTGRADYEEIVTQIMRIIGEWEKGTETVSGSAQIPFHILRGESCGCAPVETRISNQQVFQLHRKIIDERVHIDEIFQMLTKLTEGHSVTAILEHFKEMVSQITKADCYLFVNREFCRHTDIPLDKNFKDDSVILLFSQVEGQYSAPLREYSDRSLEEIPDKLWQESGQILFLPFHWQAEEYGYFAMQFYEQTLDYERLHDFMMTIARILGTVRNQSQIYEMYIRDMLTGLYNRGGFYGEFSRQFRELALPQCQIFLASVDLDNLKQINDNFGHSEGDVAIKAIADALDDILGSQGICARFGGDEYIAVRLWENGKAPEGFEKQFQVDFQAWIDRWNEQSDKKYHLGASLGVLMTVITDADEIDEMMKKTDNDMYRCKKRHHSVRGNRRD